MPRPAARLDAGPRRAGRWTAGPGARASAPPGTPRWRDGEPVGGRAGLGQGDHAEVVVGPPDCRVLEEGRSQLVARAVVLARRRGRRGRSGCGSAGSVSLARTLREQAFRGLGSVRARDTRCPAGTRPPGRRRPPRSPRRAWPRPARTARRRPAPWPGGAGFRRLEDPLPPGGSGARPPARHRPSAGRPWPGTDRAGASSGT